MRYLLIAVIFFNLSCTKEKSCEICTSGPEDANAIIVDSGPLAGDGCSWLVQINDTLRYHADVLDTSFQHNELPVKVNYQLTSDSFNCGLLAKNITVIHINSISKR